MARVARQWHRRPGTPNKRPMRARCFTADMTRSRRRRSRQRIAFGNALGRIIGDQRRHLDMTLTELGRQAGISRQMVAAVQAGNANPSLNVVVDLLNGVGVEVEIVVRRTGVVIAARQRDAAHAICSSYVQRRLQAAGWQVRREVRIDSGRYHGWIDLLAFHEPSGTLLVIEMKTRIDDLGAIERSLDWYVREAMAAARGVGWRPTRVVPWLLALATEEVEGQLRTNRTAIDSAFPVRAPAMNLLVGQPGVVITPGRGTALIDPRSRRSTWLIRTRLDDRRSDAPYRDYADFMARSRGPEN